MTANPLNPSVAGWTEAGDWYGPVSSPFTRHPANPLLTAADWPVPVARVFNPGAARCDGETVLLCSVEDRRGLSHVVVARSHDGIGDWRTESQPLLGPREDTAQQRWGAQDPRVTRVEELDGWVVCYLANGLNGPSVALAFTTDFKDVLPLGVAAPPDDRAGALLPRRVGGDFVLLHRPMSVMSKRADIWSSRSPDLLRWRGTRAVLNARNPPWWDSERIGVGPPPLETPQGWVVVYYGFMHVNGTETGRVGLALLDRDDPSRVVRRGSAWVFEAAEPYEIHGSAPKTVIPTGLINDDGTLLLYYGAAGSGVCLATARLDEVVEYLLSQPGS